MAHYQLVQKHVRHAYTSKRNVQIAIDWLDSNVPWVRRLNIHAQYKKRPNRNAHTGKQCKWTRFYPCQIVRSKGSRQTHASKQDTTESQKTNPSDTNRPHSKPKRERGSVFSPFSFSMFVPLVSAVACVINTIRSLRNSQPFPSIRARTKLISFTNLSHLTVSQITVYF